MSRVRIVLGQEFFAFAYGLLRSRRDELGSRLEDLSSSRSRVLGRVCVVLSAMCIAFARLDPRTRRAFWWMIFLFIANAMVFPRSRKRMSGQKYKILYFEGLAILTFLEL